MRVPDDAGVAVGRGEIFSKDDGSVPLVEPDDGAGGDIEYGNEGSGNVEFGECESRFPEQLAELHFVGQSVRREGRDDEHFFRRAQLANLTQLPAETGRLPFHEDHRPRPPEQIENRLLPVRVVLIDPAHAGRGKIVIRVAESDERPEPFVNGGSEDFVERRPRAHPGEGRARRLEGRP